MRKILVAWIIVYSSLCFAQRDDKSAEIEKYLQKLQTLEDRIKKLSQKEVSFKDAVFDADSKKESELKKQSEELVRLREEYFQLQKDKAEGSRQAEKENVSVVWQKVLSSAPQKNSQLSIRNIQKSYLALGDLYWKEKRFKEALEAYRSYHAQSKTLSCFELYKLAQAYEKNGDWGKAISLFQEIAEKYQNYMGEQAAWHLLCLKWKQNATSKLEVDSLPDSKQIFPKTATSSSESPKIDQRELEKRAVEKREGTEKRKDTEGKFQGSAPTDEKMGEPEKRKIEKREDAEGKFKDSAPTVKKSDATSRSLVQKSDSEKEKTVSGKEAVLQPQIAKKETHPNHQNIEAVRSQSWYQNLHDKITDLEKLELRNLNVLETRTAMDITLIQNGIRTVNNYPKEIGMLARELEDAIASGKNVETWVQNQKKIAQTQTKLKQIQTLEEFLPKKEFPLAISDKVASLGQEIQRLSLDVQNGNPPDASNIRQIRVLLKNIHDLYEEKSQVLMSAISNFQISK